MQTEIDRAKKEAVAHKRELQECLSSALGKIERLEGRVKQVEDEKVVAIAASRTERQRRLTMMETLSTAQLTAASFREQCEAKRVQVEALEVDLQTLRDKYNTLKRRSAEAGRKVSPRTRGISRAERLLAHRPP